MAIPFMETAIVNYSGVLTPWQQNFSAQKNERLMNNSVWGLGFMV